MEPGHLHHNNNNDNTKQPPLRVCWPALGWRRNSAMIAKARGLPATSGPQPQALRLLHPAPLVRSQIPSTQKTQSECQVSRLHKRLSQMRHNMYLFDPLAHKAFNFLHSGISTSVTCLSHSYSLYLHPPPPKSLTRPASRPSLSPVSPL